MSSTHIPDDSIRIHLGMEIQSQEPTGVLPHDAHDLANDSLFKSCFSSVMDEHFCEPIALSYPVLTGKLQIPWDDTGHIDSRVLEARLGTYLTECCKNQNDTYMIKGLDSAYCIRWNGTWLVINLFTPELNGEPWTLQKVVQRYTALRSVEDPKFAEANKAALDALSKTGIEVCFQYQHHAVYANHAMGASPAMEQAAGHH